MNCSIKNCKQIAFTRNMCRDHLTEDTYNKIKLLNEGKITVEDIKKDLVPMPKTMEEYINMEPNFFSVFRGKRGGLVIHKERVRKK